MVNEALMTRKEGGQSICWNLLTKSLSGLDLVHLEKITPKLSLRVSDAHSIRLSTRKGESRIAFAFGLQSEEL